MKRLTKITRNELEHLKKHKYARAAPTLVEPFTDPIFEVIARLVPRSITPNQLTVTGFCLLMMFAAITSLAHPSLDPQTCAPWLFLTSCGSSFCACLLDCIDGKHARNTKQSSVVGHWLDHGFDAMVLSVSAIFGLFNFGGSMSLQAVFTLCVLEVNWFSVWWEESVTGVVRFPIIADVEGTILVVGAGVTNYILGSTALWFTPLFEVAGVPLTLSFLGTNFVLITNFAVLILTISRVFSFVFSANDSKITKRAFTVIFPCLVNVVGWFTFAYMNTRFLLDNTPIWIATCGFSCAVIAIRLIMTTLLGRDYDSIQPVMLAVYVAVANEVYPFMANTLLLHVLFFVVGGYYFWIIYALYLQISQDQPWAKDKTQ